MFEELVKGALNGDLNPLYVFIEFKKYESELKEAMEKIKSLAIYEADKYPEKSFKAFGASIEKKSGAARWDYSHIQQWIEAKARLNQIETIAKVGGMDESGNEIERAFKNEGSQTIAISFK